MNWWHIIPCDFHSHTNSFDGVVETSVCHNFQYIIFYVLFQINRERVCLRRLAELCQCDWGWPVFGRKYFDIRLIMNCFIWKTLPVDKIYQMCCYICNSFSLLCYIIVPCRTNQRFTGNLFKEMMYAFHYYRRVVR